MCCQPGAWILLWYEEGRTKCDWRNRDGGLQLSAKPVFTTSECHSKYLASINIRPFADVSCCIYAGEYTMDAIQDLNTQYALRK